MALPRRLLSWILNLYAESFRGLPREVWLLCGVLLINRAGTMVIPFLSLYMSREVGLSTGQVSWVLVAFGLGSLTGSYGMGRLCDRLGPVVIQKVTLGAAGAVFFFVPFLESFWTLSAAVFLVAFFGDGFRPAIMASVANAVPPELQARSLGLVRMAANLGVGIGPAAGGLLASVDYRYLFVADGLTCWAALVFLAVMVPPLTGKAREATPEEAALPTVSPLKDPTFMALMVVVLFLSCILFQVFGVYPLYLGEVFGLKEQVIGLVLAFNALVILVLEMPLIKLLEKRNPFLLVGAGVALMGLGFGLTPFGQPLPLLLGTVVIWTVGEMVALPFSNSLVTSLAGRRSGEYMGIYTSMFSIALLIAPASGIWVYGRYGGGVLWLGTGLAGLVGLAVCWLLRPRPLRYATPGA